MRRWLAVLAGMAAIAVTGTALALNGVESATDREATTETTVRAEKSTTTTVEKPAEAETPKPDVVVEKEEPKSPEPIRIPKEPVDGAPPPIAILHPADGQVFETKEVVFEGTTEPRARVFAGDYEADVDDEGSWRIVLFLSKGENEVTIKAIDSSGNHAVTSVTVVYRAPESEEEPKAEEPKAEEPKAEEPKQEEPKEEEPKEEIAWEFSASQVYGECSENPPFDVFHGSGKPGSTIVVISEFGSGETLVGEHGEWELKVFFESAPVGQAFPVKVKDELGNHQVFEFIRTA